jgi:transposase
MIGEYPLPLTGAFGSSTLPRWKVELKMSNRDVVKEIRKTTRKAYMAEEKIRIVLKCLRGEIAIFELCCIEGIAPTIYYRWSKSFLDSGKNGLTMKRDETGEEVKNSRKRTSI